MDECSSVLLPGTAWRPYVHGGSHVMFTRRTGLQTGSDEWSSASNGPLQVSGRDSERRRGLAKEVCHCHLVALGVICCLSTRSVEYVTVVSAVDDYNPYSQLYTSCGMFVLGCFRPGGLTASATVLSPSSTRASMGPEHPRVGSFLGDSVG